MSYLCEPGQEGPHCCCSFCSGIKAVLARRKRMQMRATRLTRIAVGVLALAAIVIYLRGQ